MTKERDALKDELEAHKKELTEVEQILGKALGYPWYADDMENFPGSTEEDGVCVGDNTPASLADDAADKIASLRREQCIESNPFRPYLPYRGLILASLPPADSLEGYSLRYGCSCSKDEYWNGIEWCKGRGSSLRIVRTPLVKYIQTERITDQLVQVLGRLECQVRGGCLISWADRVLLEERADCFIVADSEMRDAWAECRIKEQTVIDALYRLGDYAKADACERIEWLMEIEG